MNCPEKAKLLTSLSKELQRQAVAVLSTFKGSCRWGREVPLLRLSSTLTQMQAGSSSGCGHLSCCWAFSVPGSDSLFQSIGFIGDLCLISFGKLDGLSLEQMQLSWCLLHLQFSPYCSLAMKLSAPNSDMTDQACQAHLNVNHSEWSSRNAPLWFAYVC